MNKHLKSFTIILITIIIFIVLFRKIDIVSVIKTISQVNIILLIISILILTLFPIIKSMRFKYILKTINCKISFKESFFVNMAAFPLLIITPSKSGDLIKGVYLKNSIPMAKTFGAIFAEKLFDFIALVIIVLIGLMIFPNKAILCLILFFLLTIIITFILPFLKLKIKLKEPWNTRIERLFLSVKTLAKKPECLVTLLVYSIIFWFINIIQISFILYALDIKVPLLFTMANIPMAIFIGMIPITLGGMGTRDSAIIYLFSSYANSATLLSFGILYSFLRFGLVGLAGIPFMVYMNKTLTNPKKQLQPIH